MECTYGDKVHRDPELSFRELGEVTKRTLERGGKVIVPAFAVGRTQELVYYLHQMIDAGTLPDIPVIVDSPLAVNASDIYKAHPECFDEETLRFIRSDRHRTALGFDRLIYTRSVEESKALNERHDPMVIISASGMAETGRILHHLKNNIEDPHNTILIVSWQAPNTLGRRIADREARVRIFGEVTGRVGRSFDEPRVARSAALRAWEPATLGGMQRRTFLTAATGLTGRGGDGCCG